MERSLGLFPPNMDDELRALEREVAVTQTDICARHRLARAYLRAGMFSKAGSQAKEILSYGGREDRLFALRINAYANLKGITYAVGREIEDKGQRYDTLTGKKGNITLGALRSLYELDLAERALSPRSESDYVWTVTHQNAAANVTADAVRYGLTLDEVREIEKDQKERKSPEYIIDSGLTEDDTIVEWVVRPRGFTRTGNRFSIDYEDGERHITKLPKETGWVVWQNDRFPYTQLGTPSGQTTQNKEVALKSMKDFGIPERLTETEVSRFWGMGESFTGVVAVVRGFIYLEYGSFSVGAEDNPDGRFGDDGWLRASR